MRLKQAQHPPAPADALGQARRRLLGNKATFTTVNSAFARLAEFGVVEEKTGGACNRIFAYNEYLRSSAKAPSPSDHPRFFAFRPTPIGPYRDRASFVKVTA